MFAGLFWRRDQVVSGALRKKMPTSCSLQVVAMELLAVNSSLKLPEVNFNEPVRVEAKESPGVDRVTPPSPHPWNTQCHFSKKLSGNLS